jgi:hypothetical protein
MKGVLTRPTESGRFRIAGEPKGSKAGVSGDVSFGMKSWRPSAI